MSALIDKLLQETCYTLGTQIAQTKSSLRLRQLAIGEELAKDDNALAEGENFEQFQAHDTAAANVAASFQAAYERLVEANAHLQDAVASYKQYLAKVQENTDENKSV